MTTGAVRKKRRRTALFIALALAAIWAAYRLSPSEPAEPDFRFEMLSTAIMVFVNDEERAALPYYENGDFHAPSGKKVLPIQVIKDHRYPENIDGPSFQATFLMKKDASQADFVNATKRIWSVCDAAVVALPSAQTERAAITPSGDRRRDCDPLFPNPPKRVS